MQRSQRGYSLPELLAVVIILGIATAVAIPNVSTTNLDQLELTAEEVADVVRFARSESIRTGEPHGFFSDLPNKRIRVFRADMATNPPNPVYEVYHPVSKKLYDIDLENHPFARADALNGGANYQGTCDEPRYTLFDAQGTVWCGDPPTVLYLNGIITFTLGDHTRTLSLDGISGRVSVQ